MWLLLFKSNDSFDKVRCCFNIVAKNGNNVEATFAIVERTKFYNKRVGHCCRFWQQSRMLLRHFCLLLRHCCWCGRGLTLLALAKRPVDHRSRRLLAFDIYSPLFVRQLQCRLHSGHKLFKLGIRKVGHQRQDFLNTTTDEQQSDSRVLVYT